MNVVDSMRSFQYVLNALSFIACLILSVEYIYIVRVRKPPFPWSSYAVSFLLFSVACDRLQQISQAQVASTLWQLSAQYLLNSALLLATLMIPLVRKGTYKRPRFNQLQELHKSLKYSQSLFRSYFDEAPIVAYIKDKNQKVTLVNKGLARLFGTTLENPIGKTVLWGDTQASSKRDLQILNGQGDKEIIQKIELPDRACTILDIRFPLTGPDSEAMLGGIAVDVTEQFKRKNKTEVLASIVELSPDAIYSLDEFGLVLSWNSAAEKLFGYTKDEMIGQCIVKIFSKQNGDELAEMIGRFKSDPTRSEHFEANRIRKDGSVLSVQIAAASVPDPQMYVAVINRDVTKKRQVAQQIELLNEQLKKKVEELSLTNIRLQKARDEALESASMKSAFAANISHELRTPLSGILGMSEILTMQSHDPDSQKLIRMLHESAQSLLEIIEDILDLAKLEAGKTSIDFDTFSIPELIRDCEILFSSAVTAKNLSWQNQIDDDVPEMVCSDAAIIKQILCNLLGNSIRFTESGIIKLTLSMSSSGAQKQILKFCISDTGVGIEPDRLPQLFTPFARSSRSTQGISGTGLGLALSKRLVELMRGQMGCASELGKGSTFWFSIPVDTPTIRCAPEDKLSDQSSISPQEFAKYRVLSVDDSPVVSRLTMRQLEIIGVDAEAAMTGAEAIEKTRMQRFDLVLMDVYLPDMTGYEAAQKIRKIGENRSEAKSIIIALTGCSLETLREEADSAVMDDFLEKPVNIERLKMAISKALSNRREQLQQLNPRTDRTVSDRASQL